MGNIHFMSPRHVRARGVSSAKAVFCKDVTLLLQPYIDPQPERAIWQGLKASGDQIAGFWIVIKEEGGTRISWAGVMTNV
jgi:hypothetical protein